MENFDVSLKVRCECNYRCSRTSKGFDFVSKRTRGHHTLKDKQGILIDTRHEPVHPPYQAVVSTHGLGDGQVRGQSSNLALDCTHLQSDLPSDFLKLSRTSKWRVQSKLLLRPLLGFVSGHQSTYSSDNFDAIPVNDCDFEVGCALEDQVDWAEGTVMPSLDNVGSTDHSTRALNEIPLTLSEAIYRETWRLQAMLDSAKVSIDLQDKILKALFKPIDASPVLDYRSVPLGSLLRYAGTQWDGGPLGISSLGTFNGLTAAYEVMGAPQPQQWRLCVGLDDNFHEPKAFGPSIQDDQTKSTARSCTCSLCKNILCRECESCSDRCDVGECRIKRKDMLRFDYLPIAPLISHLCRSRTYCHEILTMWRERARWLHPGSVQDDIIREWWDGSKAKQNSYFWDPCCTYELPVVCQNCWKGYATYPEKCDLLNQGMKLVGDIHIYDVLCTCGNRLQIRPVYVKGDPRNIALMAHWDGFQSASSIMRNTWTVEISILNMGSHSDMQPIPILFIPNSATEKLTKLKLHFLEAFMEPFFRDVQMLAVGGFPLHFSYMPELIHDLITSKDCTCRVRLMLFTGDHPAQCKFGGWCQRGKAPCRRCQVKGIWKKQSNASGRGPKGVTVYGNNRYLQRYPPAKRDLKITRDAAQRYTLCTTEVSRVCISQEHGINQMAKAWRLSDTFGFCLISDLVYDVMHILALNVFKSYVTRLMKSLTPLQTKVLEEALGEVTARKPKGLDGRWPRDPGDRLGYFKAEEYTRFVIFCLPHILYSLRLGVESPLGSIGMLLFEIGRLFYIKSREEGWRKSTLEKARKLLASWRVRTEEHFGENASVLEHVAGSGELLDDIEQHGPHWVYWCYKFERMVSNYGRIATNKKEMEVTFTSHHVRQFFTKTCMVIWNDDDGFLPQHRTLLEAHKHLHPTGAEAIEHAARDKRDVTCPRWHERCIVIVSSQEQALSLAKDLSRFAAKSHCAISILSRGIGVGMGKTKVKKRVLSDHGKIFVKWHWALHGLATSLFRTVMDFKVIPLKSVVVRHTLFRIGDHVIVLTDDENSVEYNWNWRAVISDFFVHEFLGHQELFFEAKWFTVQRSPDNQMITDRLSGLPLLSSAAEHYGDTSFRPVSSLLHKFIPITRLAGRGSTEIVCLELQDRSQRQHMETYGLHDCPTHPELHDVVEIHAPGRLRLAVIRSVGDLSGRTSGQGLTEEGAPLTEDMNVDSVENALEEEPEESFVDGRQSSIEVHVSWVNKRLREGCEIWEATLTKNAVISFLDVGRLITGMEVLKMSRGGFPLQWSL